MFDFGGSKCLYYGDGANFTRGQGNSSMKSSIIAV